MVEWGHLAKFIFGLSYTFVFLLAFPLCALLGCLGRRFARSAAQHHDRKLMQSTYDAAGALEQSRSK